MDIGVGMLFLPGEDREVVTDLQSKREFDSFERSEVIGFTPAELDYSRNLTPFTPRGLDRLIGKGRRRETLKEKSSIELSVADIRLLSAVSKNSRATLQSLADELGSTVSFVKGQITRLIDEGIILKFFASINPYAIGSYFFVCAWIQLLSNEDEEDLLRGINRMQIGNGTLRLSGVWTHALFLHFASMEEFFSFEDKIRAYPSMIKYESQIVQKQGHLDWIPSHVIKILSSNSQKSREEKTE